MPSSNSLPTNNPNNRLKSPAPGARLPRTLALMNRLLRYPFWSSLLVVLLLLVAGTGGYMLIEGWSFTDALFMTVITVTTIGYGEVRPLSPLGRSFTIALIITGVVTATYAIGATVELLASTDFLAQIRTRRRRKMLAKLSDHCIICGYGRLGSALAAELQAQGASILVIDPSDEAIERCRQNNIPTVQASASDEQALYEAGIERASALVAATPTDAENVFIILTARSINPRLRIIARSNSEASTPKLEKAGANTVISPYAIVGRRIAHMLIHPAVTQFLDGVLEFGDHKMRLEEFTIAEDCALAGLSLKEARLKVVVLAAHHPGQQVFTHPNAETRLLPGTSIIVMGLDQELRNLERLIKP